MREQKLRVPDHPEPVVRQSVKNHRGVPVARCRTHQPAPQDHLIWRRDRNILQLCPHRANGARESSGSFGSQCAAYGMKSPIREINAAPRAERNIEEKESEKPAQSATVTHPRKFYEVHLKEVPIEIEIRDTGAGRPQVH